MVKKPLSSGVTELLKKEKGSTAAIAAKLSTPEKRCSRQLVEYWVSCGHVTPKWAPRASKVYGIPLHKLNSTVYPENFAA